MLAVATLRQVSVSVVYSGEFNSSTMLLSTLGCKGTHAIHPGIRDNDNGTGAQIVYMPYVRQLRYKASTLLRWADRRHKFLFLYAYKSATLLIGTNFFVPAL